MTAGAREGDEVVGLDSGNGQQASSQGWTQQESEGKRGPVNAKTGAKEPASQGKMTKSSESCDKVTFTPLSPPKVCNAERRSLAQSNIPEQPIVPSPSDRSLSGGQCPWWPPTDCPLYVRCEMAARQRLLRYGAFPLLLAASC